MRNVDKGLHRDRSPTWPVIATAAIILYLATLLFSMLSSAASPRPLVLGAFLNAGLLSFGVFGVAASVSGRKLVDGAAWRRIVREYALAAAALNAMTYPLLTGDGSYTPLFRDVLAAAGCAFGVTFVAGAVAYSLRTRLGPFARGIVVSLVAIPASILSLFVILSVHCTSGDCL